jgi:hypothetical protein
MMFQKKKQQIPGRNSNASDRPNAPVFSYYSSRSGGDMLRARYEPPKTHKRGLERLKHLPTTIALIAIVGSVCYASLLDSKPRVMIAASSTGKPLQRPSAVYEQYINTKIKSSFMNRSKLTFDGASVTEGLQKQFPEVANAIITVPLVGHRPVVHIAVSSPAFILATKNGAYYISSDGKPLVRVSEVANPLSNIATVTDETSLPATVGQQVLPTDTVSFISSVIKQLQATKTPIQSITLPLEANELQVRIVGLPYAVRYNTLGDPKIETGTFLAVKKRLEGSGETPKEYIDVRVEERAYYK